MMTLLEKFKPLSASRRGSALVSTLVFGMVAISIVAMSISSYALFEHRASLIVNDRDQAFHIAEAGINYYRWHLAHAPTDYTDSTTTPGPYIHSYTDKDGNITGYFELEITPPLAGSSVVTIKSTGYTSNRQNVKRAIQVKIGLASLTNYTFLTNANMNFSFTTQVSGAVMSNGGIRFDGTSDSWVKSAKNTYTYLNQTHNGVWGAGGPKSFWQYPVPAVDFFSISSDMAQIRDLADQGGTHLSSSGQQGWHIVLRGNNYDLYRVTARSCANGVGRWRNNHGQGWYWDGTVYCYDIGTETFVSNSALPANGYIFAEDDVWVSGTIDGRITVAVGKFPVQTPYKKLYISDNLLYTTKGGENVIGLISQGDIVVPYNVPNDMEIDAGLLSQFGGIYRPNYDSNTKNSLTVFGSQISYTSGGWKYVNGWGNIISGFINTNHVFDGNLKFYPPPGFPVGNVYEILSWEEVAA